MIFLLFTMQLWAAEVVVQGENMTDVNYESHLVKHPSQQSYISYVEGMGVPEAKEIFEELKTAQFQFLKGSLEQAKLHFKNIASKKFEQHWSLKIRRIIHYSHLRLAQLSPSKVEKQKWLQKAFLFQPNLKLDSDIFSPDFIAEYNQMKLKLPLSIYNLPKGHENFQKILVNGSPKKDRASFIRSYGGDVKISFLSNHFLPIHMVTDVKNLAERKLQLKPIASGTCTSPQIHGDHESNTQFILLDENCSSWKLSRKTQTSNLSPQTNLPPVKTQNSALYRNKWFWVGASILAAGVAWHQLSQQNSAAPHPSTPQGVSSPKEFRNK